ncbi:MAG: NAD(P)/FAD-dependent oxidoreductase [Chloroflexota bacterium]|nr:NAD(P)/FAD-dependent oxidoreductase [Chloroflexota bacterium]
MPENFDVVIVGAGAAGLMCAIEAGNRGRRVAILEHADRVGKKILISGGGRCNFTNVGAVPSDYLSQNPHFSISAMNRYTPQDFIGMVEQHNIPYHEKKLGQLFCNGSSQEIVDMLSKQTLLARVNTYLSCTVTKITGGQNFTIYTNRGTVHCDSLVMATGGPSIPQMGASRFSYDIATQFDMDITEVRPGLVPLRFRGEDLEFCKKLVGLSIACTVSCGDTTFEENLLFTHRGLSGPAILQVSSYWKEGTEITINLLPGIDIYEYLRDQQRTRPKSELSTTLSECLPRNFARAIVQRYWDNTPINQISEKALASIADTLANWRLIPSGTQGYRMAEVSLGGINTSGLSSRTMESTTVPGLYFIGEAVDVTGPLGGYNFQWAWASGYCAGQFA